MDNADLGPAMAQSYAEGLGKTAQRDNAFLATVLLNVISAALPNYFEPSTIKLLQEIARR